MIKKLFKFIFVPIFTINCYFPVFAMQSSDVSHGDNSIRTIHSVDLNELDKYMQNFPENIRSDVRSAAVDFTNGMNEIENQYNNGIITEEQAKVRVIELLRASGLKALDGVPYWWKPTAIIAGVTTVLSLGCIVYNKLSKPSN